MNRAILQLLYLTQEALDKANDSLSKGTDDHFDAQARRVENGLPATLGSHLVTLSQVQALLVGGGYVLNVGAAVVITITGDGVTTDFSLAPVEGALAANCFVDLMGLVQHQSAYSVNGEGTVLSFVHPPDWGMKGEIRIFQGQIVSDIPDNSISGTKLKDATVPGVKMVDGAIDTNQLNDLAVTNPKVAGSAILGGNIGAGEITPATHFGAAVPSALIAVGLPATQYRRTVGSGTNYWWGKPALVNGAYLRFVAISIDHSAAGDGKQFNLEVSVDGVAWLPAGRIRENSAGQDTKMVQGLVLPGYQYRLNKPSGTDADVAVLEWWETDIGFNGT